MMVEHLTCSECGDEHPADMQALKLCEPHESVLRALLIQRGFGKHLDMTVEERVQMFEAGQLDTRSEVTNHLIMGVVAMFGGDTFIQYDGCPVCVLEGTLVRAVDEVAANRRKSN